MTDDFLVFDKNKSIHFDHLIVVKANKEGKSAYVIVGQYRPGRWFTYINTHADDFINELINRPGINIIEKDVVRYESFGIMDLSDGMSVIWYNKSGQRYMYFKKDDERVVYSYFPVLFFKRDFGLITDESIPSVDLSKHQAIILFDPWKDATGHLKSVEEYEKNRINEPDDKWNESYGPGCWSQVKSGCLGFIIVMIIIFIIAFIMA